MGLSLSLDDLARIEATARSLLSPLAFANVETWQHEVNTQIGHLLGGDHTLFRLPSGRGEFFSEDGQDIVQGLMTFAQQVTPEMITYWDEAPNVWHHDRRVMGIEAFNWATVAEVVRRRDLSVERAPVWNEVFFPNGVFDYAGLITTRPEGDAILWSLGPRLTSGDAEARLAMLRLLVPAFKAGLDTLDRLAAQRHALDAVSEPLVIFDADGVEVYRNAALVQLLAQDAEAAHVEAMLLRLSRQMRPLGFPLRRDQRGTMAPTAQVQTARARYTLRGALLQAEAFGPRDTFLVSVQAEGVAAVLPSAEALRAHCGLTRREAETALLVAQGLSNDAIAEKLFVSRHTVRHHVESLMAKLEITGRGREAVAARLLDVRPVEA